MAINLAGIPLLGDAPVQQAQQPVVSGSPESIKAQRDYAKALMYGTVGKDGRQFPVVQSWTQGLSNMANALMGGLESGGADAREQAARNAAIAPVAVPGQPTPPGTAPPTKGSFSEGPSSEGQEKTADEGTSGGSTLTGDKARSAEAIASIESADWKNKPGGQYAALGPQVLHGSYAGDRAYGKYQVMGNNVGPWTKEVLGKAMTPQEFLANPQAQDQVFAAKFTTPRNWFGHGFSDGYMKGTDYEQHYANAMNRSGGQPATASAFAGPDNSTSASPAVQAIANTLKGGDGTQVAQNGAQPVAQRSVVKPNNLPAPGGGGQLYIDPKLIKPPPQYTPAQMNAIMNLPESAMPAADKSAAFQQFRNQQQGIIDLPYPGGHVRVDMFHPTNQQFIPDLNKGTKKIGDIETPYFGTITPGPNGTVQENPAQRAAPPAVLGPQSQAAPAATPVPPPAARPPVTAAAPVPVPRPAVAPGPAVAQTAPVAAPAPPAPGVQVASNDPAQAFAAGLSKEPLTPIQQQMMAMAGKDQPVSGLGPAGATPAMAVEPKPQAIPVAAPGVEPAAAEKPVGPLAQAIASKPPKPPDVSQEDWDSWLNLNQAKTGIEIGKHGAENAQDVEKDSQTKAADFAAKKYDALSTQAQSARTLKPNVDLALALMNDKNFHSGMLSGAQDIWSRFKAAALGDKYANAPNETFDKLMASNVLGTMKTALGGLGQVRLAEIQLLNKANGNRYNTDASNRAVLEISRRGLDKVDQIDGMGQQYASGDEVTDPSGKVLLKANTGPDGEIAPRHGLDVGFDKLIRKWTNDNPSFTPEQIKNYETIFDTGRPPEEGTAPKPGEGEIKVGTEKQFKQGVGVWDGKQWQPKK
jgi:hypothetical protein